jgi:Zn-dependent protease/CBS domain-containing protein
MMRQSISLGRILGIPIGLDYSWFLIFFLLTWMLAGSYYPAEFPGWSPGLYWLVGAVTAIMLFASVLAHELGHSIVAVRYGIPVRRITLFIFGGVAELSDEPRKAVIEFWIAVAGPFVSLFLAVSFGVLAPLFAGVETIHALLRYLAFINGALVVFNLIPGFPLDGGRIFRAFLWAVTGNFRRATLIAAYGGRLIAFLFIIGGVWLIFTGNFLNGIWMAFIGWFLDNAASAQIQYVQVRGALSGYTVANAMIQDYGAIPDYLTLQELVDSFILGNGQRSFVVKDTQGPVGLLTVHQVKDFSRQQWPQTPVVEAMIPLERMLSVRPETPLWTALSLMDRKGVNQLPVVMDGRIIGMLSRDGIISFLGTMRELGE